jgi:NADPH:quinone reductase-like Zn-dependent oxidoreductase
MGQDFSGVVERTVVQVGDSWNGDEVLGAAPLKTQGAFAEKLITAENRVVRKPALYRSRTRLLCRRSPSPLRSPSGR